MDDIYYLTCEYPPTCRASAAVTMYEQWGLWLVMTPLALSTSDITPPLLNSTQRLDNKCTCTCIFLLLWVLFSTGPQLINMNSAAVKLKFLFSCSSWPEIIYSCCGQFKVWFAWCFMSTVLQPKHMHMYMYVYVECFFCRNQNMNGVILCQCCLLSVLLLYLTLWQLTGADFKFNRLFLHPLLYLVWTTCANKKKFGLL
mgnify:CR=1 FL=1